MLAQIMLALMLLGLAYHGHAQECAQNFETPNSFTGGAGTADGFTYTFACKYGYSVSGVATCTAGTWDTAGTCNGIACTCPCSGIDTGSTAGACTCASGYTGTVTYDATSITGGCDKTCAGVNADARVFNLTSGMVSDPAGDASATTVSTNQCMCPDGEYGIIQPELVVPCQEVEAGAAEHQIEVTVQVDKTTDQFDSAQVEMTAAIQAMAWGISGVEFAHIKFNSAMESANNAAHTDAKFTVIFPSEEAATAALGRFAATATSVNGGTSVDLTVANVVMLTIGEVTLTPLNGASQLGYSVPAAVAAAALLW